jgi:transposase
VDKAEKMEQFREALNLVAARRLPENHDVYITELARALSERYADLEQMTTLFDSLVAVASTAINIAVLAYTEVPGVEPLSELEIMHRIELAMEQLLDG